MNISLLQLNLTVGDIEGNANRIINAIKKNKNRKTTLFITSELALTGYPPRDLLLNQNFINKVVDKLEYISSQIDKETSLLIGSPYPNLSHFGKKLFNSALLIQNKKIVKIFKKTLLPTYDVFDESRYFAKSEKIGFFEIEGLKIGVTICEDIWNDNDFWFDKRWLYQTDPVETLISQKVDLIINISASPFSLGKQEFRERMIGHIARKYKIPIIYSNQIGGNDDLVFDGRSCAFDRNGTLTARGASFKEDILHLNTQNLESKIAPLSKFKEEEAFKALVLGTRDYIEKCGFKKAVLGLSGGIDSSLTAVIAVEAIGKENITGIMMPSPYTAKESIDDASKLAQNLGIKIKFIPINRLMKEYEKSLLPIFSRLPKDATEENIQARIRGNILMAISNKFKSLVLSTGNKSELSVGYCTLYGDLTGGLSVIGDVPKTFVYKIADWFNKNQKDIIPQHILKKAPSAELKPNQRDQDILPDYSILDKLLYQMLELHQSRKDLIQSGFKKQTVDQVFRMVKDAEFKRQQAPPAIRITDRAFGSGWRIPIAYKDAL